MWHKDSGIIIFRAYKRSRHSSVIFEIEEATISVYEIHPREKTVWFEILRKIQFQLVCAF